METIAITNRYIVHGAIGAGGMGAVYRASDRLSGEEVALKQVTVPPQQLMFASRAGASNLKLALAQEFKTLASLRHPNIVSVRDYGFDNQRMPFFTMDLLEGASTIVEAGKEQPLDVQIDLLLQLLQALAYLHRRGVLHHDLKPSNIMVLNGQVKLLDFGLSLITERSVAEITQTTVGTLAYMAPELFGGARPSRRSDLYAVGMVAYEMFAGEHPFIMDNLALLITQVLSAPIDFNKTGKSEALNSVLERLLNREEKARYRNATETIKALCKATETPLPLETIAIRESYLQSARFVGREKERETLAADLKNAINGKGGFRLVGGESGIGKTRLGDEIRILAMVEGMLVLNGQAIYEGGNQYQVWREILRPMVLAIELDDEQAAVLKTLVPDIGNLLGREIPDAPDLNDPQQNQVRLFKTVEACIRVLRKPTLFILEDLHWAGSESLALLERLGKNAHKHPVLFIGNYRDDELPDLPRLIGNPPLLQLRRFTDESIEELSAAMLGKTGRQPEILEFLRKETEGNVYFLVEVVRALAEEAGDLERIDTATLAEYVTAGGIEAVLERRLNRVTVQAMPLLQLAAVAGRRLDLDVLHVLDPEIDLNYWLTIVSNVAVLDVQDGHWRFSHDKLREQLLEDLGEAERRTLSQKVAEAIEAIHPEDPAQSTTLAYLWSAASNPEKELHYSALAGLQAYQNRANREATHFLKRALQLLENHPETPERAGQEVNLQLTLGFALMQRFGYGYAECAEAFNRARSLCESLGNPPEMAVALWGMAHFYFLRGDYDQAVEMGEAIRNMAPQAEKPAVYFVAAFFMLSACRMITGDFEGCLAYRETIDKGYRLTNDHELSQALGYNPASFIQHWYTFSLHAMGYQDQAAENFDLLIEMGEASEHVFNLSQNLSVGSLSLRSMGDVEKLRETTDRALEIVKKYEFLPFQAQITNGWAMAQSGQVDEGIALIKLGLGAWIQTGAATVVAEYYYILADVYRLKGLYQEGLDLMDKALKLVDEHNERYIEVDIHRLKGDLKVLIGTDHSEIEQYYQKALEVAKQQKARLFELRATVSLARLWQSQGRIDEARRRLADIYEFFTEGFDTKDLVEAKSLLDELG